LNNYFPWKKTESIINLLQLVDETIFEPLLAIVRPEPLPTATSWSLPLYGYSFDRFSYVPCNMIVGPAVYKLNQGWLIVMEYCIGSNCLVANWDGGWRPWYAKFIPWKQSRAWRLIWKGVLFGTKMDTTIVATINILTKPDRMILLSTVIGFLLCEENWLFLGLLYLFFWFPLKELFSVAMSKVQSLLLWVV
jgi:hypothetical protein